MKKDKLWKKFIRILLFRPSVISLAGLTMMSLIAAWTFEFKLLMLNVLPLVLGGLTIGTILQIFILQGKDIAAQALDELKGDVNSEYESRLDSFHDRLSKDGDPRTEKSLKNLRELAGEIKKISMDEDSKLDPQTRMELHRKVDQLFERCVNRLEKSIDMIETAKSISDRDVRYRILGVREKLLDDVNKNVAYLGDILERIQLLHVHNRPVEDDYSQIMRDLDESIDIALKVDERMRKLESGENILE